MVVPTLDFIAILAPLAWRPPQVKSVLALAVLGTILLAGGGRRFTRLHLSVLDELPFVVTRMLAATGAVAVGVMALHQKDTVLDFLGTACQATALVILGRVITARLIAVGRRSGIARHRTVVVGTGRVSNELTRILREHREYGLAVVGFVEGPTPHASGVGFLPSGVPHLGSIADLDHAILNTHATTLLIADGEFSDHAIADAIRSTVCRNLELFIVPRLHHLHTLTGMADHIGSIPIMRIRNLQLQGPARLTKRAFDLVVASLAILLLAPLLLVAALAVRLEGGPGVIFRQIRVGQHGRTFELLKFRSMTPANNNEAQTQWSVANDIRVGPAGRLLRATSVDELPQLWNIIRGDMTLVGPRPERPHFVERFSTQVDRYTERHRVQVGLTGLAQVSGLRGDTSIADRARYDNYYIENWSLWLDIKIILRTFREVLFYRER